MDNVRGWHRVKQRPARVQLARCLKCHRFAGEAAGSDECLHNHGGVGPMVLRSWYEVD